MELGIWLRDCEDHCECIAVHANDLLIASKDPNNIVNILTTKYEFKLTLSEKAFMRAATKQQPPIIITATITSCTMHNK